MNTFERNLLSQMLNSGQSRGRNDFLRRTACEFVIDNGWWYTPMTPPKHVPKGKANECFKNAFDLAFDNPDLIYVEGYATLDQGLKVHHAWVTDGKGNAIDNTWPTNGLAYAGIPFNIEFVNLNHVKNEAVICLIDDHFNNWPLLRDLGEKPDLWLEKQGFGAAKIVVPGEGET